MKKEIKVFKFYLTGHEYHVGGIVGAVNEDKARDILNKKYDIIPWKDEDDYNTGEIDAGWNAVCMQDLCELENISSSKTKEFIEEITNCTAGRGY